MNTSEPSPRVNAALAAKMQGKRVLLVGRAVEGDQLACSDEGLVSVKVSSEGPLPVGSCVEIRGIMESHNVLAEDSRLDFGNAFDLKAYNHLCNLSNDKYSKLFSFL